MEKTIKVDFVEARIFGLKNEVLTIAASSGPNTFHINFTAQQCLQLVETALLFKPNVRKEMAELIASSLGLVR